METADIQMCEEWLKDHAAFWQTLNRSEWAYEFHPKTLIRYVEVKVQWEDEIPLILEYLNSDDCIPSLSLYDQAVSGDWKPVRAWVEMTQRSAGSVRALRLYHALQTDPAAKGDGPYVVEDGCAYKVSWTYYWNQPSVIEAPASTSGVSYRVGRIDRDPETGLFSYSLEKRERVQQDIPEYLTAATAFEDVKEEVHLGVRADAVASAGKAASVGGGVRVERHLSKNEDCTTDVRNVTHEDKAVADAVTEYAVTLRGTRKTVTNRNQSAAAAQPAATAIGKRVTNRKTDSGLYDIEVSEMTVNPAGKTGHDEANTIFEKQAGEQKNQANDPGKDTRKAGGGKTYRRQSRRNEDGTWDVSESATEENAVSGAVVVTQKTLRGKRKTVTSRNQSSPAPEASKIGQTVTSRMTDGGRYDNEISETTPEPAGKIGHDETATVFERRETGHSNTASDPGKDTRSAGGGKTYSRNARQNEDGTWDVTEATTEEKPVAEAVVETQKTLRGTRRTVTSRNQTSPAAAAAKIGQSVTNRKTDGGLYDTVVSETTNEPAGKIGHDESGTIFEKQKATHSNVATDPGEQTLVASGGVLRRRQARQNEQGTFDVTEATTEEKPVANAVIETRVTLRGKRKTVTSRNQSSPAPEASQIGETVTSRLTDGGRYDTVVSKVDSSPAGHIGETCEQRISRHTHSVTVNQANAASAEVSGARPNVVKSRRVQRNDDTGTYDVTDTEETYSPQVAVASSSAAGYADTVEVGENVSTVPQGGNGAANVEVSLSVSPNDHGTLGYNKRTRTYIPKTNSATVGSEGHTDTVEVGANVENVPAERGGTNEEVSLSMSPNDHGTFSYTKHTRKYSPQAKQATGGSPVYTDEVWSGIHQASVQSSPGGTNQEVSVSVSPNDHGTFSYTKHTRKYSPQAKQATGGSPVYTDEVWSGIHQASVQSSPGGTNQEVSVSVSPNDHGTMSVTKHTRTYFPKTGTAISKNNAETSTTTVTINDPRSQVRANNGTASIMPNDHGSFTTHVTEIEPNKDGNNDTGWITWHSTAETENGKWKFSHGLRVMRNQKQVPHAFSNHNNSISVSVNRFGLLDIVMSYKDFDSYTSKAIHTVNGFIV